MLETSEGATTLAHAPRPSGHTTSPNTSTVPSNDRHAHVAATALGKGEAPPSPMPPRVFRRRPPAAASEWEVAEQGSGGGDLGFSLPPAGAARERRGGGGCDLGIFRTKLPM